MRNFIKFDLCFVQLDHQALPHKSPKINAKKFDFVQTTLRAIVQLNKYFYIHYDAD